MSDTQTLEYASTQNPQKLDPTLRFKLSAMMFLQYAIWGAWYSVLSIYLGKLHFTGKQNSWVYAAVNIAAIISPLFGQIADRWAPTQVVLGFLHLAGAVVFYLSTRVTEFWPFFIVVLIYQMLYMPTLSLTNALSFHHIPNVGKQFPGIRVFGTIGWIVIGLVVGYTLDQTTAQPLVLAAVLSVAMGVFCFFLPNTPPRKGEPGEGLAFTKALGLLRDSTFSFFLVVSLVIAAILAGYFTFTPRYLESFGIKKVAAVMTIGQLAEMLLLPLLPFFLRTIGMKGTLLLGMAAWGIRYGVFALGHPLGLVYGSLALHGICYDFFFVAGYIYVDNNATPDVRASAQALFNLVVLGVGMLLGNIVFGMLYDNFTTSGVTNWRWVWLYPALAAVIALVIFVAGFREKKNRPAVSPQDNL